MVRFVAQKRFLSGLKILVQHRYPGRTRNQGVAHGPASPRKCRGARGVEPCGRTRALRTHETVRPSALGQVFEADLRCGEASAEVPHVLWILRPAHARIVSTRPTGVNRRSIKFFLNFPTGRGRLEEITHWHLCCRQQAGTIRGGRSLSFTPAH